MSIWTGRLVGRTLKDVSAITPKVGNAPACPGGRIRSGGTGRGLGIGRGKGPIGRRRGYK